MFDKNSVERKAALILFEGRLRLHHVDRDSVLAKCEGEHDRYYISFATADGWSCTCPARGHCSHLLAAWSVVLGRPIPSTDPYPPIAENVEPAGSVP